MNKQKLLYISFFFIIFQNCAMESAMRKRRTSQENVIPPTLRMQEEGTQTPHFESEKKDRSCCNEDTCVGCLLGTCCGAAGLCVILACMIPPLRF